VLAHRPSENCTYGADLTVSNDSKWLAVIYSAAGDAHVAVFSIDAYGDLTAAANSASLGVSTLNGVAISQ
jgi:6-phosphogluconolactonase (cycloisomerase 2 family)